MSDIDAQGYPPLLASALDGLTENAIDLAGYRVDFGHSVDAAQNAAVTVIGQDWRSLFAVDLEPGFDGLGPVIGAAGELGAATAVAYSMLARPIVPVVVAGAALVAAKPPGQPVDEDRLVDIQQNHVIEPEAVLGQHRVERLCLRHVAWKTVEYETPAAIRLDNAAVDHFDDD